MADLKISQFVDGGVVQSGDEVAAVRAGVNTKIEFGGAASRDVGLIDGDLVEITEDSNGDPVVIVPRIDTQNRNDWGKQQYFGSVELLADSSDEVDWDLDNAQVAYLELTDDFTLNNPTNFKAGSTYILEVQQDGTGGHSLTFDTMFAWPLGFTPVVQQGVGETTMFTFICNYDQDVLFGNYNFYD